MEDVLLFELRKAAAEEAAVEAAVEEGTMVETAEVAAMVTAVVAVVNMEHMLRSEVFVLVYIGSNLDLLFVL